MKKLVTLFLALALILSMCSVPAFAAEELDKDAEIVLWLPGNGSVPGYEEGATEDNNRFVNAIREKTGYKNLKVYIMPATDNVNYMNMSIAAGDYPDAIYLNGNREFYLDYLNQGFWAPVDEVVAKYGPNIEAQMTDVVWATAEMPDGLHYALPVPRHTSYNGVFLTDGIMHRSDLMDDLGVAGPTTIDEFYQLLVTVKEKYPDMIPYANTSLNSNRMKDAFGMWAEFGVKDGKVVSNYDANIKEYLTFMNKLYTEGLLDVESAYQTSAQRREKIVAGKIFAWDDGVWSKEMRQAWAASGTPYKAEFLPELANTDGTKGQADAFPSANMWCFPVTGVDHHDEVIDIINTFLGDKELEDFVNYGILGEHYTVDENGVYQTLDGYEAVIYKIYYRLWFKPDVWWNNAVLGDFVTEIESWYKATEGSENIDLFSYMPTSDAQIEFKSTVGDIFDEYTAKIITGELPLEAADEMLSKMYANGYTQIIESCQEWYDANGKALAESLGI